MDALATRLIPLAIPRVETAPLESLSATVTEEARYGDPTQQANVARWLRAARQSGLVPDEAVRTALDGLRPSSALYRLAKQSIGALTERLNRIATEASAGTTNPMQASLSVTALHSSLAFTFTDIEVPHVGTLDRVPLPVARVAYAAIDLVSRLLFPAMLPHHARTIWWLDELRDGYGRLVKLGIADDPEKALEYIESHETDFEPWLYRSHHEIADVLEAVRCLDNPAPAWMRPYGGAVTLAYLESLRARIRRWRVRQARWFDHPWSRYADDCLAMLLERFPNDRALRLQKQRQTRHVAPADGHAYIGQAILVYSGSTLETLAYDAEINHMNESGEFPGIEIDAARLADQDGIETLEGIVLGAALLIRAGHVNDEIERAQGAEDTRR